MGKRPKKTGILEKRFQENLRDIRKASGFKQKHLAEKMGWPNENYVSQIENGHRGCSIEMAEALAEVFQVDPADFFYHPVKRRHLRIVFDGLSAASIKKLRKGKGEELLARFRKIAMEEL
jgi:transcriptional regulator with XRE-family HTH domain